MDDWSGCREAISHAQRGWVQRNHFAPYQSFFVWSINGDDWTENYLSKPARPSPHHRPNFPQRPFSLRERQRRLTTATLKVHHTQNLSKYGTQCPLWEAERIFRGGYNLFEKGFWALKEKDLPSLNVNTITKLGRSVKEKDSPSCQ